MPQPVTHDGQNRKGPRVGLLGGSFNPPHAGHREITLAAIDALRLDEAWWLVTPGSPLKDARDYAPYEARLAAAREVANEAGNDARIIVSDVEARHKLQYTVDTVRTLTDLHPETRFCWLMGADSLQTFHLWRDWRVIARLTPIAVFSRPGYENAHRDAAAAKELSAFEVESANAATIMDAKLPAWTFVTSTANPLSSTQLRASTQLSPPPPRRAQSEKGEKQAETADSGDTIRAT